MASPVPNFALQRQVGIAIGVILVAVAVVAALSVALTVGARVGSATSETNSESLLATALINQATMIKSAMVITQAKDGYYTSQQHLNNQSWNHDAGGIGIYSAIDGGADPQTPPPGSTTASSTGWRWLGDNWSASVYIPGLADYHYLIALSYVDPKVCAQIDKQLTGSATIPIVSTPFNLQTLSGSTDLRSNAAYNALTGYYEICFVDSNNEYQYYRTIVDDSI